MSVQATSWVWANSKADGTTLLVALALADAANADGERSCQAVATIAKMVRSGERTVQRALRSLEQAGEIVPTGTDSRYRTAIYAFPGMSTREGDMRAAVGNTPGPRRVSSGAVEGDTAMSPDPKELPQRETPSTRTGADAPPDPFAAKAREIVTWWWDGLKIKPAGRNAWHSTNAAVLACLNAGHEPKAVASALRAAGSPASIPRLEIELGRGKRGSIAGTNPEHWAKGGTFD